MTGRPRILFWVQHLLGIGHLARTATLARAMTAGGFDVVVASGGEPAPVIDVGAARLAQLPSARAVDVYFKILHDADDRPIDDAWRTRRLEATRALYREVRPHALVTELFPFGRRQFRFELEPLLAEAEADGVKTVASVRDILVAPPKPERLEEMLERARRWYDLVLVHGDPTVAPFEWTFPHLARIAERVRYTGYVVDERRTASGADGTDEILVSAGGGAVAEPLLRAAMAARPMTRAADARWRFLVGHNLPAAVFDGLAAAADGDVIVERARRDFPSLLQRCRLSVSQGGYNTVMETLAAGARAVIAPYAGGLETEQTLRAEALQARGALEVVPETALTPERLAAAIDRALAGPPSSAAGVNVDGAAHATAILKELVGGAMSEAAAWRALDAELDRWAAAGAPATLWLRDDDAIDATPELDRLLGLAAAQGLPLALAAIPALARPALARRLAAASAVSVLQHGYAHANHAGTTEKKSEYTDRRDIEGMTGELVKGRTAIVRMFGAAGLPVLAPPWNRIAAALPERMPALGLTGLTRFGPRRSRLAAPGVVEANTHVDLIEWRAGRRGKAADAVAGEVAARLADRRAGRTDAAEPTGLLSHHLAMDAAAWSALAALLDRLGRDARVRWLGADEIFPCGAADAPA